MARVMVIGAGTAGICAAKTAMENGMNVVVYEQADQLGGLWAYSKKTGNDEYGLDTNGYMYKDLKTNAPKEIMNFPDFEYSIENKWFLEQPEVLEFLQNYAEKFNVNQVMRLRHCVIRVAPTQDKKWEVIVKNLKADKYDTEIFDYVMVCSGHYSNMRVPDYKGRDSFQGKQIHSKLFKDKDDYKDQRVLVVGSSASAFDIAFLVAQTGKEVFFSQHILSEAVAAKMKIFPDNLTIRPDVKELTERGAIFTDDSSAIVDTIIYCTGFNYSFPFLSTDCGISVDDNHVQHLYKHIVNIKYPTMAFIGLTYLILVQDMVSLQSRFVLKFWSERKAFPTATEMLEDEHREFEKRIKLGWSKRHAHKAGELMEGYFADLAEVADITPVRPVNINMYHEIVRQIISNFKHFREDKYEIIDDVNFVRSTLKQPFEL